MSQNRSLLRPSLVTGLLCVLTLCFSLACDERGGASTVIPNGGGGGDSHLKPEGEFEGESIDELALRLDRLTQQHQSKLAAGTEDAAKCEELCELSQAICEIKTKMCEIADERVSDDEYQNLCRTAKQRCQAASQSCVRCVEHHQRSSSGIHRSEPASCEGEQPSP